MTRCGVAILAAALASWSAVARGAAAAYRVDPANSRMVISVGKAGAFSFIPATHMR